MQKLLHPKIKNLKTEAQLFRKRMVKAAVIITLLIIVLLARLVDLQVINYKFYSKLAQQNQLEILPIEPKRGLIYDRTGILLAENVPVFNLNIIPDHIVNLKTTLAELKKIIELTPENITQFKKALRTHKRSEHIPLKVKLTQEETANFYVNQFRFPGVAVEASMIRNYPLGATMANVVGYTGRSDTYNNSNFVGKTGIEKHYEAQLHGTNGYKIVEVDASGRITRALKRSPPTPGNTLFLTVDSRLQQVALNALGDERGAVVAIDPNTGEILALASNPSFDPNLFVKGIDQTTFDELQNSPDKPLFNRAISSIVPIASTIKPILAIAALDTGTITNDFTISDPGWFRLPNSSHQYRDWAHGGHGTVNVTKAIIESCDTFFYTIAIKLGISRIDDILHQFDYGKKTGIDLDEESTGVVASPLWKLRHTGKHWYPGDTVNSGIGQGFMSTTPLQLANAAAILAGRGEHFLPHLLWKAKAPDDGIIPQQPQPLPEVKLNNEETWDLVIAAMQKVVMDPRGTAFNRFGANPAYTVAGKTGGAQLFHHKIVNENPTPVSEETIPKRLRNHNLFIAFAPVDDPKIAIAVVSENSLIAPTVARKVLDYYLLTAIK
jgi:penicillin-binding protein 2